MQSPVGPGNFKGLLDAYIGSLVVENCSQKAWLAEAQMALAAKDVRIAELQDEIQKLKLG